MPSPFPGMDPYLERPSLWPNVHDSLMTQLRDELQARLRPDYWVAMEERVYIAGSYESPGRPDLALAAVGPARPVGAAAAPSAVQVFLPAAEEERETYLEIRLAAGARELVTVLEILSPANKRPGTGRDLYAMKRGAVIASRTNLVEIDLLRAGPRIPSLGVPAGTDYTILVSRSPDRPRAELYPLSLGQPIPSFPIPLRPGEEEPEVSLARVLEAVYDRGGFDLAIDYRVPPEPPLSPEDEAWADALLREKGLR